MKHVEFSKIDKYSANKLNSIAQLHDICLMDHYVLLVVRRILRE
jgi:hypothetical protein